MNAKLASAALITLSLAAGIATFIAVAKSSGTCTDGAVHRVILSNDAFTPQNISVKRCDVLKFINEDSQNYYLAFGQHDKHIAYPNFSETTLSAGQEFSLTASKLGSYELHDHLRDKAKLELTVSR